MANTTSGGGVKRTFALWSVELADWFMFLHLTLFLSTAISEYARDCSGEFEDL